MYPVPDVSFSYFFIDVRFSLQACGACVNGARQGLDYRINIHLAGRSLASHPRGRLTQTVLILKDTEITDIHDVIVGIIFIKHQDAAIEILYARTCHCSR